MSENTHRINVTFPGQLLQELDTLVPAGKRSEVIVAATATYLARLKVLAALKETGGAWAADAHPELATPEDINHWLTTLRAAWRYVPLLTERQDV